MWGYTHLQNFYNHTYNIYKEAVETFGLDNISIDRIDNSKDMNQITLDLCQCP